MTTDIRTYKELKDICITMKCNRCNSTNNTLEINWVYEVLHFICLDCGYDNVLDQGIEI